MVDLFDADRLRRLRGAILTLIYDNHARQSHRLEMLTLAGALERLFFECSLNDLVTVLQDLRERGYLTFEETKDKWTRRVRIGQIQITPSGRDVVEGTRKDPAIEINE